ncbi:hypothetical protein PFISCL1PPCAC_14047, partial [Pristionchus fissidentatus]
FSCIYRVNLRIYQEMQTGAKIDNYSVARTFQVKENVEVLQYMSWLARGWIVFTILSAFSYTIFDVFVAL